jgi:hypothetical protein
MAFFELFGSCYLLNLYLQALFSHDNQVEILSSSRKRVFLDLRTKCFMQVLDFCIFRSTDLRCKRKDILVSHSHIAVGTNFSTGMRDGAVGVRGLKVLQNVNPRLDRCRCAAHLCTISISVCVWTVTVMLFDHNLQRTINGVHDVLAD